MGKRYYKIDVNGHGGENVMGFVNDEKDIELLRKLAEDEEVGWSNEDEESGHYVEGNEIDDIFHVFGGEVNDVSLGWRTMGVVIRADDTSGFIVNNKRVAQEYRVTKSATQTATRIESN